MDHSGVGDGPNDLAGPPEDRAQPRDQATTAPQRIFELSTSPHFAAWLAARRASLAFTTYQTAKLFLIGLQPNGRLSMPHSPRWYRGSLWLVDSGSGYFGRVDLDKRTFEPLVFCPGFARGLAFLGDFAIVGLSDRRENRTFQDLELEENLKAHDAETRAGLLVVDLQTFTTPHWLRLGGVVRELYDVGALEGIVRPMALGFRTDEIRRYLSYPREEATAGG